MDTPYTVPTRLFLALILGFLPFQASAQAPASCPAGKVICGTRCVNLSINVRNCGACGHACGAGETCSNGACTGVAKVGGGGKSGGTCPTGNTKCETGCVDLLIDAKNCGACGQACRAGQTCSNGACTGVAKVRGGGKNTGTCPTGNVKCETGCVNLSTDPKNCGACGRACRPRQTCTNGVCSR